jgi:hypothetical protein
MPVPVIDVRILWILIMLRTTSMKLISIESCVKIQVLATQVKHKKYQVLPHSWFGAHIKL